MAATMPARPPQQGRQRRALLHGCRNLSRPSPCAVHSPGERFITARLHALTACDFLGEVQSQTRVEIDGGNRACKLSADDGAAARGCIASTVELLHGCRNPSLIPSPYPGNTIYQNCLLESVQRIATTQWCKGTKEKWIAATVPARFAEDNVGASRDCPTGTNELPCTVAAIHPTPTCPR